MGPFPETEKGLSFSWRSDTFRPDFYCLPVAEFGILSGMSDLSLRFQSLLSRSGLIPPQSRVLVAVSGGADSVALLLLLARAAEQFALYLEAAHLDHGLRPESKADLEFVKALCTRLEVSLVAERRDIYRIARARKGNLEETARLERRDFLRRAAQSRDAQLIALGHHRDDQAETFLMQLLRGAGPTGLSGMRMKAECFVRPLLGFSRSEILAYLASEGQPWREDSSNADRKFTRNRVRHELLPLLREFNPNIGQRLADLCSLLAEDEVYWDQLTGQLLAEHCLTEGLGLSLPRSLLLELPPALAGRLVRLALSKVRGDLRQIGRVHVADVLDLASGETPQAEIDLPGCQVARRYERMRFLPLPVEVPCYTPLTIGGPGCYPLPDGRLMQVSVEDQCLGEGLLVVEFCADEVAFPLTVRTFQPGDRLQPDGMRGSKKLQDLFVDAKLTRESRSTMPLVVRGEEILWVVGMRRCRGYRSTRKGRKVVRLSIPPDL